MEMTDLDRRIVGLSALIGAEKNEPDNYKNFIQRSHLFYEKGLFRPALEDAKAALRYSPQNVDANIAAGRAALKLGRYNDCYTYYKDGMTVDPNNGEIKTGLKELQEVIMEDYEKKTADAPERTYNAVELCSQDYYPGDDELYKLEAEILLKKYKIDVCKLQAAVEITQAKKTEAATLGVCAYNARQDGRFQEALQCCQVALQKDPSNYRLLHMRAQSFNDLGEDVAALKDLMLIPKAYRFLDVWKLGGKILYKFNLPVMTEFWLRKATSMIPEKERRTDLEAQTTFQRARVGRVYGPLTDGFPVKVDFTEYGRAVFATDDIAAGEDAFHDRPVVIGQVLTHIHLPACSYCGNSLITPQLYFGNRYDGLPNELKSFANDYWPDVSGVSCEECKRESYCSKRCKQDAWEHFHQILCPAKNPAATMLYDLAENQGYSVNDKGAKEEIWVGQYSPLVLAKIWAIIITGAKRLMKEKGLTEPTTDIWARAKMPFRKFISYGSMSAIQRMPEVFQTMQKIFEDCGDGISYSISEGEFEARYYQATCNLQAFCSPITPLNLFMENIAQSSDIRAFSMLKYLKEKPPKVRFAGMFPLHACLNHSCDNNVMVMDGMSYGKPGVEVRAKRDIKPGEELFTTYIDTSMPRKLRRAWLYKSFNFWCGCKRCEFEGDDNTTCTHCKKVAAGEKKFAGCSRCKKAWYCSTKCQKQSWVKGHKDICNKEHSLAEPTVSEKNYI